MAYLSSKLLDWPPHRASQVDILSPQPQLNPNPKNTILHTVTGPRSRTPELPIFIGFYDKQIG